VVRLGIELIGNAAEAGISLVRRNGTVETSAASSDLVVEIDRLQYQHGEGPCLSAIRHAEYVYSPDIAEDERWPAWGREVAERTRIRSMFCFRIFVTGDTLGALNFYAPERDGFDDDDRDHGLALAAHAAIAMTAAFEIEHLKRGMDSRNLIGQAQGILMERYGITAEQAFSVLVRASTTRNIKLRDTAADLVDTRDLPRLDGSRT
jgi:hypothetical protein